MNTFIISKLSDSIYNLIYQYLSEEDADNLTLSTYILDNLEPDLETDDRAFEIYNREYSYWYSRINRNDINLYKLTLI